ncbi:MAG: DDE-type integrase/transposase/recombinase, partial [Candidatus Aminicenantes bacterium]|nr:DDE-type integrase/transposase/recombinase [Candidatus Aminicenantes bacterium]
GELAHIDVTKIPKDIRCPMRIRELYVAAVCDDCTRLTYAEIIKDKKASTLTYFMARSLSWFKQIYNFEYEAMMTDNVLNLESSFFFGYTDPFIPSANNQAKSKWLPQC